MQKILKFFIAILCGGIIFFACKKENSDTNGSALTSQIPTEPAIISFDNLNAKTKVEDSILIFETFIDFKRTINFLQHAAISEVEKWESSLSGFRSIQKYYALAKSECKDTLNQYNVSQVAAKYSGKVILSTEGYIYPLIGNGSCYGRIVGDKGIYRIGNLTVLYFKGKVIAVTDGDLKKIEIAKRDLSEDIAKGIYIHDLIYNPQNLSSNSLSVRGTIVPSCYGSCPAFYGKTTQFDTPAGETNFLQCSYNIVDNGVA